MSYLTNYGQKSPKIIFKDVGLFTTRNWGTQLRFRATSGALVVERATSGRWRGGLRGPATSVCTRLEFPRLLPSLPRSQCTRATWYATSHGLQLCTFARITECGGNVLFSILACVVQRLST